MSLYATTQIVEQDLSFIIVGCDTLEAILTRRGKRIATLTHDGTEEDQERRFQEAQTLAQKHDRLKHTEPIAQVSYNEWKKSIA